MTEEANKALEAKINNAIDYFKTGGTGQYGVYMSKAEAETIRTALTRLSELEPIVQELVEARKLATGGKWEPVDDYYNNGRKRIVIRSPLHAGHTICHMVQLTEGVAKQKDNAAFIALAANRISKMGEGK